MTGSKPVALPLGYTPNHLDLGVVVVTTGLIIDDSFTLSTKFFKKDLKNFKKILHPRHKSDKYRFYPA